MLYAGKTRSYVITPCCPRHPAHLYGKRIALCWRDTYVSAQLRNYMQEALHTMLARHVRVRPAPHICSGRTQRYAGATRKCSAPPCTYEHDALRAMQTRHARVSPSQPPVLEDIGSMLMQHARTCFPRTSHMCGKRSALRWRDAYVSAQLRKYMQEARRAM